MDAMRVVGSAPEFPPRAPGLGIARLPGLLAHEAIQAGRLVPLLDDQAPPPTPLQLVLPGGTRLPARTRAFIDFVQPRLTQALAGAGLALCLQRHAERSTDASLRDG